MTKTPNYDLNQWDPEDKVIRTDFNEDNAKIDAALAGKAEAAVVESLQTKVDAVSAQKCEIICGTYVGDGAAQQNIVLGRKPKAVLLFMRHGLTFNNYLYCGGLALADAPACVDSTYLILTVTNTGFTVYDTRISPSSAISTNSNGINYHYIAFF